MNVKYKDLKKLESEVIENICNLSECTMEQANHLYVTFPYYMELLHQLSKGVSTQDIAWFILNELELAQ
tara:strand:- start:2805 stop:3011 length:207 start_codon:yes stop_codon:yes gene_type:complete